MQTMEPHQQLHSFFLSTTRSWILRRNSMKFFVKTLTSRFKVLKWHLCIQADGGLCGAAAKNYEEESI